MYSIEVERTLVRSPHEVWDKLCDQPGIARWLGGVQIDGVEPPTRIAWKFRGANGVIELEAAPWGTRVRARVMPAEGPAWERLTTRYEIERALSQLFADLGSRSLGGPTATRGGPARGGKEYARRRETPKG
jgi:uncharacterized protein YndB with AHSA1/START domain